MLKIKLIENLSHEHFFLILAHLDSPERVLCGLVMLHDLVWGWYFRSPAYGWDQFQNTSFAAKSRWRKVLKYKIDATKWKDELLKCAT